MSENHPSKQKAQEAELQRIANQKKIISSHDRKFNTSSADTEEEIDALANNTGSVDTEIEREYHGLNKNTLQTLFKDEFL